ncbi:hypothetical protein T265_01884 [Opisthorchis viverrini]|uniref:Guanylate kinase-like domain-containing protein n=1 Tax=Opisthorchis viverrini TaxID=6198 RepID=A0A075AIN6_OPIVI|nr:hypothetical protein T265_01884 [Opisthorchis viverrini]KER31949.1 hypothetical protein T265_01884 [Opisthorchis viverrini]
MTKNQFKCLISVADLQSPHDANVRTRLLSRNERDPQSTLQKLTTERQHLINLKADAAMIGHPRFSKPDMAAKRIRRLLEKRSQLYFKKLTTGDTEDEPAFRKMRNRCKSEIRQWNIRKQATILDLARKNKNVLFKYMRHRRRNKPSPLVGFQLRPSCSHTTRKMRVGEVDGRDYHFTTKEKMLQDIAAGKFWEHAEFAGNLYGTSVAAVEDVLATGRICILDVEMVGVRTIHSFQSPFNTKFILIRPPSIESLEQRLRERNTETDETLRLRIQRARQDIEFAESPAGRSLFNKVVINNDLDTAYADLEEFLRPFIHQPTS